MLSSQGQGLQTLTTSSLRQLIEEAIISAVVGGQMQPGQKLVESVIAEQLGVSRSPVREALSALEREGIVDYQTRRGYFLVDFTPKDIEEIYDVRLVLELMALRRVTTKVNDAALAPLQALIDALGEAVRERRDYLQVTSLDLSFHRLICELADNSRLLSAWNSIRLQTWLLIGLTSQTAYEYPDQPREFHQYILNAILARDLDRASTLLREHIIDAKIRALDTLANRGQPVD